MIRHLRVALPVLLALVLLVAAAPTAAQPDPDRSRLDRSLLAAPGWHDADPDQPLAVVVQLAGPTALDLYRRTGFAVGETNPRAQSTLDAIYDAVGRTQAPARRAIQRAGGQIISTYDSATNGFLVYATRTQVERMTHAPGVRRIYRAPIHYPARAPLAPAALEDAVPTIGAKRVRDELGLSGRGVNVAIIDTGIDYTHRALGGIGGDAYYNVNRSRAGRDFPTRKVVGGYDFAGVWYTGGNTPQPDDNPLDEHSHGTHVAGISAGEEVRNKLAEGVAPNAKLIALKVFGARGGTNLANDAIEWAIEGNLGQSPDGKGEKRVDVINMSLGSGWAYGVQEALGVVERATQAGIVVVASAGNSGNAAFVTGSPGASPHALSVASTFASGETGDQILVVREGNDPDAEPIEMIEASPDLATEQIRDIRSMRAEMADFGTGCDETADEEARDDVTDKIALVDHGHCPELEFLRAAEAAGAAAVVAYGDPLQTMGLRSDEDVEITAVMIGQADGEQLLADLEAGTLLEGVMTVQLLEAFEKDYLTDVASVFTSRGPSRAGHFKPNIAAPGSNIYAARIASGDEGVHLSGTSMAGPMVAGTAALLIERLRHDGHLPEARPPVADEVDGGLTALDVAAMLMNYAGAPVWHEDSREEDPVPFARGGTGRVDIFRAARADTIVRAGPIASVNFGIVPFDDVHTDRRTLAVRNISDAEKRYQLSVDFVRADDEDAGVHYRLSTETLTVPAGQTAEVELEVEAVAAQLKRFAASGGRNAMSGGPEMTDAEFDAHVVVTEVERDGQPTPDGDEPRVPIFFMPRAVSDLEITPDPLRVDPATDEGTATVRNHGAQPGTAELFALLGEDEQEASIDPQLDVDAVGARVGTGPDGERTIEFAVHTRGPRYIPFDSEVYVFIDVNQDGRFDAVAYNSDLDNLLSGGRRPSGRQDVVLRVVGQTAPIGLTPFIIRMDGYYADVNLRSRTVLLPVKASALGIGAGEPIAVNAVVLHQPNFPDVRGGPDMLGYDVVPDGAVERDEQGRLSIVDRGLTFDTADLGFDLGRWQLEVAAGGTETLAVTRLPGGPLDHVLAAYPLNDPDGRDIQILAIEAGTLPTPTPTARPTRTPGTPVGTWGDIFLPLGLQGWELTAGE